MIHRLHVTDEELRNLALATYLGNWMANAQAVPGEEPYPAIESILQKLYKLAKEDHVPGLKIKHYAGQYSCVEHDSVEANETYDIIRAYDEDTMFESLAHMLASRDTHEKIMHSGHEPSTEKLKNSFVLEETAYNEYIDEFAEHGLGRVVVDTQRRIPCEEDD